jgi:hypothetical protein
MAAVNKTKNQKDAPKTFRIRYKDGQEDYVGAHSFSYHPKQGDLIKFYDENAAEADDLLLRAPEVASVISESRMVDAPPLLALQNRMQNLEGRLDTLEKNLVNTVAHALDVVLKMRGLQLSPE